MRRVLIIIAFVLFLPLVASATRPPEDGFRPPMAQRALNVHPDAGDVMRGLRIYTARNGRIVGIGSACPTSSVAAVTAYHVVEGADPAMLFAADNYGYQMDPTRLVRVRVLKHHEDRDLAVIVADPGSPNRFGHWYRVAKKVPLPGAPVRGTVVMSDGSHAPWFNRLVLGDRQFFVLQMPITPGTSGSCALDENGDVFGVFQSGAAIGAGKDEIGSVLRVPVSVVSLVVESIP